MRKKQIKFKKTKAVKLVNLFVLALFCQVVFSQNNDILKSFNLQMNKSVEMGFDSTIITKALKIQFKIPDNYEFKRQIIKETKDIMSEKRELQLKKTHNAINPKELINNIK